MPGGLFPIQLIIIILFFTGCTSGNQSQLIKKGQHPLTAEQIFTTVSGNSLHLEAADFDAILYFQKNGKLSAADRLKNGDTGKWDITSENELCLEFKIWYYGDSKCYSIFHGQKTDSFIFFTGNGARYYSAELIASDPYDLAKKIPQTGKKKFLRKELVQGTQFSAPLPAAAPSVTKIAAAPDIGHLARNCPGCNLAGVDLSKAQLIGANLAGADLSGSNLSGANLRRADLTGANLSNAKCTTTNLAGAILINSNLSNVDFTGSNLIKAKLNGATTEGAIFTGSHLEGIEGYK